MRSKLLALALVLAGCHAVDKNLGDTRPPDAAPPLAADVFGPTRWAVDLGGARALNLALDGQDDVIVGATAGGVFAQLPQPGPTPPFSGMISKRAASDGHEVWTVHVTSVSGDSMVGVGRIALDPSGAVFAIGTFTGLTDFGGQQLGCTKMPMYACSFLAKYDPSGALLWVRGTSPDAPLDYDGIALAGDGTLYVTGQAYGTVDLGHGATMIDGSAGYLLALGPDGAFRWGHLFTGDSADYVATGPVTIAADGDVVVSGGFHGSLALDGVAEFAGTAATRELVARFASTGDARWVHVIAAGGDGTSIDAWTLQVDAAGDVLAFGSEQNPGVALPYAVMHVLAGATGDELRAVRSVSVADGRSLALMPDGSIVTTGFLDSATGDFGSGMLEGPNGAALYSATYLAAYDAAGNGVGATAFSGGGGMPWDVHATAAGGLALVGQFEGTVDFRGIQLTSQYNQDLVVTMLDPRAP